MQEFSGKNQVQPRPEVRMGGKSVLRILVKGERDVIDSLLAVSKGDERLDRELQDLVNNKYSQSFQVELIYESGGRSDLWLQQLEEASIQDKLDFEETLKGLTDTELASHFSSQPQSDWLRDDIDILVFSTQAEITKSLWQHQQTGYLVDIPEAWEQRCSEMEKQEFQQQFSSIGLLSTEQSQANFSQMIQVLKERTSAYVIFYNCCDFDPRDRTANYHNVGETLRLKIQRLNLALLKLSMQEGISLIDVESLLAELGAAQHVAKAFDYSSEAYQVICQEFLRVVTDVGFFENRSLLKQIGRRRDHDAV